jgi:hypothetical protein
MYLGYLVAEGQISADPSKIDRVRKWPVPTSQTEILSFVGFANFYRMLIPHF